MTTRYAPIRRISGSRWTLIDRLPRRLSEAVAAARREQRRLEAAITPGEPLGPAFDALRAPAGAGAERREPVIPAALALGAIAAERLVGARWEICGEAQVWALRPRDAQLACAAAMAAGDVAELDTGEGKTLAVALAAACWALVGRVHVVTANDYLARRDAEWMGPLLRSLGLSVGLVEHETPHEARQQAYRADVTYASVKELGADYLRDSLTSERLALLLPALETAILDEVDFILVDEARIPLILAQQGDPAGGQNLHHQLNEAVARMVATQEEVKARIERELDEIPSQAGWSARKRRFEATVRLAALLLADPLDPGLERRFAEAAEAGDGAIARRVRDTILRFERKERREELLDELLFTIDRRSHAVQMTERGLDQLLEVFGDLFRRVAQPGRDGEGEDEEALEAHRARVRAVHNLIAAHVLYRRDRDYIVDEGKVVLIDQPTGRPSFDRHLQHGLHRALEAKEGLYPALDHQTAAEITFPGLFQLYERFCGTSGTSLELGPELRAWPGGGKRVVRVPPHRPVVRADLEDVLFRTAEEKAAALVSEVLLARELRQPVLIGTASVEQSEWLSARLAAAGVPHEVLNARHHEREARIVARAGEPGAVTVATAMAGRGTDIRTPADLDRQIAAAAAAWIAGRLERGEARGVRVELFTPGERDLVVEALRRRGLEPAVARGSRGAAIIDVGEPPATPFPLTLGLRVIGFERLGASRLDRQLRGRTGRQGAPGSTRFYLSLDDETVLIHADRVRLAELRRASRRVLDPLSGHAVRSGRRLLDEVRRAWRTAEELTDRHRARLDRLDVVDQAQRTHYDGERRALLFAGDEVVRSLADEAIARAARDLVAEVAGPGAPFLAPALALALDDLTQVYFERRGLLDDLLASGEAPTIERAAEALRAALSRLYAVARASHGPEMAQVERTVLLDALTEVWRLLAAERPELREQAELYAYANRKPEEVYRALAGRAYHRALAAAARTAASVLVTFPLPREIKTPRTGLPVEERVVLALFDTL